MKRSIVDPRDTHRSPSSSVPGLTRRSFGALGALSVGGLIAACSNTSGESNGSTAGASDASEAALTVMITCYPTRFLVERIGGDLVDLINPVSPGVDPHGLELSVQQVAAMSTADLIVQIEHYQSAIDEAIASQQLSDNVLNLSDYVRLMPASAQHDDHEHDDHHEDDHAHEDHDDHGHDDDHAHDHEHRESMSEETHDSDDAHAHDHGGIDPHFWHDPRLMIDAAAAIKDRLVALDAAHASTYETQFEALSQELTELDAELDALFDDAHDERVFITSHAAFGYLAHRYDLTQISIAGLEPDAEPSTQRLLELAAIIEDKNVNTVFFETTASPAVAEALADRTGAQAEELDNLETQLDASKNYSDVMRDNAAKLVESWT